MSILAHDLMQLLRSGRSTARDIGTLSARSRGRDHTALAALTSILFDDRTSRSLLTKIKARNGAARKVSRQYQGGTRMSHTPHELAEEFPGHVDKMHELKQSDAHFARLFDEYHEINRAVHRAETNIEPMETLAETDLRKQRAHLKDEIWHILSS
jgi:uncharacterized protein YdcH (DUF465 family)